MKHGHLLFTTQNSCKKTLSHPHKENCGEVGIWSVSSVPVISEEEEEEEEEAEAEV